MEYISKKFEKGDILSALDLNNIDDGIIEAIELAEDAALKGAQADYNENDSTSASYIKNRPFYEGYVYEPITWDGVIGDRESVDVSTILPGTTIVKVSDTFLTYEELLNSVYVFNAGNQVIISADSMASKEEGDALGAYGLNSAVISCFDSDKIQEVAGIPLSTGVYFIYQPNQNLYVTSLSKAGIKKIDAKFLPELASGANMEKGTGPSATQQLPDGVAEGFDFTGKNSNAEAIDNTLSAVQPYGATGEFAAAFGGKASAQGRRAFACGTTAIAKGKYSFAAGENTAALGNSSSAEGMQTTSVGYAAHAQNGLTIAYGDGSHAQNYSTKAIGDYSTATGVETIAEGIASFTAGRGTKATVDSQMVVGRYNEESEDLFVVGTGTDEDNPYTAFSVGVDGSVKVNKSPEADNDVVRLVDLDGLKGEALNLQNGVSNTIYQLGASASNSAAAAFNQGKAQADLAFATGTSTASGWLATATGYDTVASTAASFSTGQGTQTGKDCQTVVGRYNLGTQGLFEVGCGSAENRFNGLAVHPDGYLIIRRADGQYYNLNLILDALNGWIDAAKI